MGIVGYARAASAAAGNVGPAMAGPEPAEPAIHGSAAPLEPPETRDSRCQDAMKPGIHGVPCPSESGQTQLDAALAAAPVSTAAESRYSRADDKGKILMRGDPLAVPPRPTAEGTGKARCFRMSTKMARFRPGIASCPAAVCLRQLSR